MNISGELVLIHCVEGSTKGRVTKLTWYAIGEAIKALTGGLEMLLCLSRSASERTREPESEVLVILGIPSLRGWWNIGRFQGEGMQAGLWRSLSI